VFNIDPLLFQGGEEGGEEKAALEEDDTTKINMEHYYQQEYDQYAEGMNHHIFLLDPWPAALA
jgi:hypothetical protein